MGYVVQLVNRNESTDYLKVHYVTFNLISN